jgi:hypothetical protein
LSLGLPAFSLDVPPESVHSFRRDTGYGIRDTGCGIKLDTNAQKVVLIPDSESRILHPHHFTLIRGLITA